MAVEEKSNEITAIPALLEVLARAGSIVTIDAIGCHTAIVAKVGVKAKRLMCGWDESSVRKVLTA